MIPADGLKITVRNLFSKWFPKVPTTDAQLSECAQEWSHCKSTMDVFHALEVTRKKQRGPRDDRLTVEDGDDLADVIRIYTTAVLRGMGKLPAPTKRTYSSSIPTPAQIIAGGGYNQV
jgi:hypothetical protein